MIFRELSGRFWVLSSDPGRSRIATIYSDDGAMRRRFLRRRLGSDVRRGVAWRRKDEMRRWVGKRPEELPDTAGLWQDGAQRDCREMKLISKKSFK